MESNGRIVGNDNDADESRFEPHYEEISNSNEVQIYEPIIADASGNVTTGLLEAVGYAKDNRLLPTAFDKATAGEAVRVHGGAVSDSDFTGGGDQIRYRVAVPSEIQEVQVRVRLLFQSIGFRWARNLSRYDSFETNRFVHYYAREAAASAVVLSEDSL